MEHTGTSIVITKSLCIGCKNCTQVCSPQAFRVLLKV
ncbi:MAG: 4Fe-4S binding protein [Campylobacteraceae bacterium]|nr:4Fe-4S binding protein [Campylobacteraceae bacterium]